MKLKRISVFTNEAFGSLQALLATLFQTLASCTLPAAEYYFVYSLYNYGIGPQAWIVWAVALFTGLVVRERADRLL